MSVVVDTVERSVEWTYTQLSKELLKGNKAKFYSASAVVFVSSVRWAVASRFGLGIFVILPCSMHTMPSDRRHTVSVCSVDGVMSRYKTTVTFPPTTALAYIHFPTAAANALLAV